MKAFYLIIILIFSFSNFVFSSQISEDEAIKKVEKFCNDNKLFGQIKDNDINLAYTSCDDNLCFFYVFNIRKDGFVIVGANDVSREIIGYSENGEFNISNIKENLKTILDGYSKEIENAVINGYNADDFKMTLRSSKIDVKPMLKSEWGQGQNWYKMSTPSVDGQKCLPGCVAVAMAQIMNYYEYPLKGEGINSYSDTLYEHIGVLSRDFSKIEYDWELFDDVYSVSSETSHKQAVSDLLSDCGISVNMQYGKSFSGALCCDIPSALVNNFSYDASAKYIIRNYYTDEEWEEIIYNELVSERPVIYSAISDEKIGHCFVCDGYNASLDLYHINWGWSGEYDGYYAISGTNILNTGKERYIKNHEAVINIKPQDENISESEVLVTKGNLVISTNSNSRTSTQYIIYYTDDNNDNGIIYNANYDDKMVYFNLKYENVCTGEITYGTLSKNNTPFTMYGEKGINIEGYKKINFNVKNQTFPLGFYNITIVYRDEDSETWHELRSPIQEYSSSLYASNGLSFSAKASETTLKLNEKISVDSLISPSNAICNKVTFSSSDDDVITIDDNGIISALSVGEVTLTGTTLLGEKFSFNIKVVKDISAINDYLIDTKVYFKQLNDSELNLNLETYNYIITDLLGREIYKGFGGKVVKLPSYGIFILSVDNKTFKIN